MKPFAPLFLCLDVSRGTDLDLLASRNIYCDRELFRLGSVGW